jgi:hypothetical protein
MTKNCIIEVSCKRRDTIHRYEYIVELKPRGGFKCLVLEKPFSRTEVLLNLQDYNDGNLFREVEYQNLGLLFKEIFGHILTHDCDEITYRLLISFDNNMEWREFSFSPENTLETSVRQGFVKTILQQYYDNTVAPTELKRAFENTPSVQNLFDNKQNNNKNKKNKNVLSRSFSKLGL